MPERIRVTVRWVQILDILEPFYEDRGEFRFTARVIADGRTQETRFPKEGYYEISKRPAWNQLSLNRVVFEGAVESSLVVELLGEELDMMTANDMLDRYRREFRGVPSSWLGTYGPGTFEADIDPSDPESMSNWRISYAIEKA